MKREVLIAIGISLLLSFSSGECRTDQRDPMPAVHPVKGAVAVSKADFQHALRSGQVEVDIEALQALASSAEGDRENFLVQPFDDVTVEIDGGSVSLRNGVTLVGRPANGENGVFILSWAGRTTYAMLEIGLSRYLFQSNPDDRYGVLRVREVDQSSFPKCGTEPSNEPSHWRSAKGGEGKSQPANHKVVELMMLYSPAMAANFSGEPAAFINTLEASLAAAYSNSSVTGDARVVRYHEVAYTEPGTMSLSEYQTLRNDVAAGNSPFTGIPASRANYRADLVVMLVDGANTGGVAPICGIANVVNSSSSSVAYAAMQDGCAAGDLTFAHEVTHLTGGRHDWALDNDTGYGGTSEAHGYTNTTIDFRTIMGSRGSCTYAGGCSRLSRFSSPSQTVNIGGTNYAVGVTDDSASPGNQETDMVTVLGTSIPDVALYEQSGDAAPGQPASHTVDRLCSGNNELSWPAPSGTTGWYEVETSTTSGYASPLTVYRGGSNSVIINVSGTRWVRVRACNAEGCGSYRNGSQTATVSCP